MQAPESMSRNNARLCIIGLLVSGLVAAVADCQCEWLGRKISFKVRAILTNEIFAKVLRRRATNPSTETPEVQEGLGEDTHASDGNIFNLMAVDASSVSEFSARTHTVWVNFPLQVTIASVVLYSILGISGILGILLMAALFPLNLLISRRQVAARIKVLRASDARVQASNEVIKNIRTIKLCAWEAEFRENVRNLRRAELSELRGNFLWWSISMTMFFSLPFITTILTLFSYTILQKRDLEAKVAFPALAAFAVLRIPLDSMAISISYLMQSLVSINRIERFLKERETNKYDQALYDVDFQLGFDNASFRWPATFRDDPNAGQNSGAQSSTETRFQLSDLDVKFRQQSLNVIFGPSGSGKSSMLLALLGEMELIRGRVASSLQQELDDPTAGESHSMRATDTAYCPQEPWILNQTIRNNILFGKPLDLGRYIMVQDAVCLAQDLAELDEGDLTLAGERGSRLSGGQKQRVALARALYSDARILLLDDCLSALDSRTGRSVFFQALKGPLMENRTCILATHHTKLALPHCDFAIYLEHGRVKRQGTASEFTGSNFLSEREPESDIQDSSEEDAPHSILPAYPTTASGSATAVAEGASDGGVTRTY
ncbi:hypothetical protein N7468_006731 [Penicillium chermesinum]|uniref:Uncharacterized protein n=1 Tax=Penicillium chermesinum TaxID=63820 RepID=A0A9W9NTH8_9EURO|nr:uncharacterized protein N7468_006731 [Penicillium chermesinum]KAJ5225506.1 hypothetical protein N7468_006731 [Penicillium chermesinum]